MKSFLDEVIAEMREQHGDEMYRAALILPGRRALRFARRIFSTSAQKTQWAPAMFTLPQLQSMISGLQPAESLDQIITLQTAYEKVFGQAVELDEFLDLGRSLISDFDEVCNYDVNPDELFRNLREAKELDDWAVETWSFDTDTGEELSASQQKFNTFWQKLGKLFEVYNKTMRQAHTGYPGLIALMASRQAGNYAGKADTPVMHFAGFHALKHAEARLIEELFQAGKARMHWDVDVFYTDELTGHEAGHFIRQISKWPFAREMNKHHHLEDPPEIHIHETTGQVAQTRLAAKLVEEINAQGDEQTAVVLCDEGLLFPFLHAFGKQERKMNLTMGLTLSKLTFWPWLGSLLDALRKVSRNRGFSTDALCQIMSHRIVRFAIDSSNRYDELRAEWMRRNKVFADEQVRSQLQECLDDEAPLMDLLFAGVVNDAGDEDNSGREGDTDGSDGSDHTGHTKAYGLLEKISAFTQWLAGRWYRAAPEALESTELYRWMQQLNRLQDLFAPHKTRLNFRALEKLLAQAARDAQVDFIGEPLEGLQVMGLLETRAIDFKRLIVVGLNEGVLPGSGRNQSFIPYDLRKSFGMPTHKEREALFAYHFYRLLHRAKSAALIYFAAEGGESENARSRYIDQLMREVKGVSGPIVHGPNPAPIPNEETVMKTPEVIERLHGLLKRGLSPSALGTYLRSPLDFYRKFIARVPENDLLNGQVDALEMGNAIHKALENVLKKESTWQAKEVRAMKKPAKVEFEKKLLENLPEDVLRNGANLIALEMGWEMIDRWLQTEAQIIEAAGEPLRITATEQWIEAHWQMDEETPMGFGGYVDRQDITPNGLRLVDYKTGKVNEAGLKVNNLDEIYEARGINAKDKAIQLLCYAAISYKMGKTPDQVVIANLRDPNRGLMPLQVHGGTQLTKELIDQFIEVTNRFVQQELLNTSIPFKDE